MSRIPELEAELVASAERLQRQRGLRRPATLVALAAAVVAVVVVVLAVLGVIDTNDADRRPQPVALCRLRVRRSSSPTSTQKEHS